MLKRTFVIVISAILVLMRGVQDVSASYNYDNSIIRNYVENTPRDMENDVRRLARYLARPFDNDYDKAKAIAFWIASHINYDSYLYNDGKPTRLRDSYKGQTPREILKTRAGICSDFSELFFEMCRAVNIRAYKVYGYVYNTDRLRTTKNKQNNLHEWNYFVYKHRKIYVDTTFMSGGYVDLTGRTSNLRRRQALNKIRRENMYYSHTHDFNDFYFDFSYKNEAEITKEKRVEQR